MQPLPLRDKASCCQEDPCIPIFLPFCLIIMIKIYSAVYLHYFLVVNVGISFLQFGLLLSLEAFFLPTSHQSGFPLSNGTPVSTITISKRLPEACCYSLTPKSLLVQPVYVLKNTQPTHLRKSTAAFSLMVEILEH